MDGDFEQWCSEHLNPAYSLTSTPCSERVFDCIQPSAFDPCLFSDSFASSPLEEVEPALKLWDTDSHSMAFSPTSYGQSSPQVASDLDSPSMGVFDCPPLPPPLPLEAIIVSPLLRPCQPPPVCRCVSPTLQCKPAMSLPGEPPIELISDGELSTSEERHSTSDGGRSTPEAVDVGDEEPDVTSSPDSTRFNCPLQGKDGSCMRTFTRKSDAIRHARSVHCPTKEFTCPICGHTFARPDAIAHHLELKRCFQKRGRKKGVPQPRKGGRGGKGKASKGKGRKGVRGKRMRAASP